MQEGRNVAHELVGPKFEVCFVLFFVNLDVSRSSIGLNGQQKTAHNAKIKF